MRNFDALVIGSGLCGSIIARFLAEALDKKVQILERRNHIAGNMYDYYNEHKILVHKYGPHVFHTCKKELVDYLKHYGEWEPFKLFCMAKIDNKFTPTPFNFSTIDSYFEAEKASTIKNKLVDAYPNQEFVTILELLRHNDPTINSYAKFLYEKDYKPYTAKQWGINPEKIDISILSRVPVRLSYNNGYFDDVYQLMPKEGYTSFFNALLDHPNIVIDLNVDALDHIRIDCENSKILYDNVPTSKLVVYTGALDELFQEKQKLPYRSLRFKWKHESLDSFQDAPVVAYPQEKDFTRITEYKKLPIQDVQGTTYAIEYPLPYNPNSEQEPYYPLLTRESIEQHSLLQRKARLIKNLFTCGRLADYKYYNMDQAIERALEICDQLKIFYSENIS